MKKRYEVLGGKHTDKKGRTYRKGEVIETKSDLETLFPNKFKRLSDVSKLGGDGKRIKIVKDENAHEESDEESKGTARGTEVTSNYADLVKGHGLRVFERDDHFHVYDGKNTKPVNKTAIAKGQVKKFITDFLDK